jgi:hypothetical protein
MGLVDMEVEATVAAAVVTGVQVAAVHLGLARNASSAGSPATGQGTAQIKRPRPGDHDSGDAAIKKQLVSAH